MGVKLLLAAKLQTALEGFTGTGWAKFFVVESFKKFWAVFVELVAARFLFFLALSVP